MNGADARWPGAPVNHLRFQNQFHVLLFPIARDLTEDVSHAMSIHQKFTSGYCPATADSGRHHNILIRVGIDEPSDDGVVLISPGFLLHGAVQHPATFPRVVAIFDPELIHFMVVCKMKAQRRSQPEGPAIVKGPDKYRRSSTQVRQAGADFALYPIGLAKRAKQASDVHQRTDIIDDYRDHPIVQCDFALRVLRIAEPDGGILTLVSETKQNGLG